MSNWRIVEASGEAALEELRAEWQALYRASAAPPFLSWEWMAAWQRWLSGGRTPYLLCARAGGQLVGLLPLCVEEISLWRAKLRRLTLMGAGYGGADYLDALALPEHAREATERLWAHLARHGAFDMLELDHLAEDSPSLPLLAEQLGAARCRLRVEPRYACPHIELTGDWPSLLKRSRRGDNFKRQLKKLRARAGFEYRVVTEAAEAEAAFARFLALHEARWAGQGGSDATGHAALQSFQREVVQRLAAAGLLRFEELWVEDACRASIYGIDNGSHYYYYNAGYDLTWRQLSPGLVLLGLSIEDAVGRGIARYDFLRGEESYKFDWASGARATVCAAVARRGAATALFHVHERCSTKLRALAKALLPEQTAEALRQANRSRQRAQGLAVVAPLPEGGS